MLVYLLPSTATTTNKHIKYEQLTLSWLIGDYFERGWIVWCLHWYVCQRKNKKRPELLMATQYLNTIECDR